MYNKEMEKIYKILETKNVFKLILGLGNKSIEEIKKIAAIYANTEVDIFDIAPDENILKALITGIESQGKDINDYVICASYPVGDDKHGKKAFVDEKKCTGCKKCLKMCPYNAICFEKKAKIDPSKCIGCGKCKCSAIKYIDTKIDICDSIKTLSLLGVSLIELHISTTKTKIVLDTFGKLKKEFPSIPIGVCLSREKFSDTKLKNLLARLKEINGQEKLIIQADGLSMNGGENTFSSTLQAISTAQILQPLGNYILVSGGTNEKTSDLASLCEVEIQGVSIGSYGRLLIKDEVNNPDFWYNKSIFDSAVEKAKSLVSSVKNYERND